MKNKTKMWKALEEFRKDSTEPDCTVDQILSNAAVFMKNAILHESFHIRMINPDTSNLDLKKGEGIYFRHASQVRKLESIGEGSALAASTRKPIWKSNVSFKTISDRIDDELTKKQQQWLNQITGYVVLPLIFRRRVIGTLSVHFSDNTMISDPTHSPVQDVLNSFANALSSALWLVISVHEGKELAKSLRAFDSKVAENISPEDRRIAILRECTRSMCKLTSATFVFYYEYDGAAEILTTRRGLFSGPKARNVAPPQYLPANVGIAGDAVINKESQCVLNFQGQEWDNQRKSVLDTLEHEDEKAFVKSIPDMKVIPVIVNNEVDGVFVAITPLANWFSKEDQNTLVSLADKIGACLKAIQVDSRLALQSETLKNISLISNTMGKAPDKDILHRLFLLAVSSGYCLRFSQAIIFLNNENDSGVFNAVHAIGFESRIEAVPSFQRGALDTLAEQIEVCKKYNMTFGEGALELRIKDFSLNLDEEPKISKDLNENKPMIRTIGEPHLFQNAELLKLLTPPNEGDVEYLIAPLYEGQKLIGAVLATRAFLYPAEISDTDFNLFLVIRDAYVQMLKEQHHKQQKPEKKHVFLSYCHDNADEVQLLYSDLKEAGITLWWDKDIKVGQNINTEIRQAMRRSYVVMFCFSKELMERSGSGVYPELRNAIAEFRKLPPGHSNIMPVLLSECEVPDIEISDTETLNELKSISLFLESERSDGIKKLVKALESHQEHI